MNHLSMGLALVAPYDYLHEQLLWMLRNDGTQLVRHFASLVLFHFRCAGESAMFGISTHDVPRALLWGTKNAENPPWPAR